MIKATLVSPRCPNFGKFGVSIIGYRRLAL